MRYIALILFSLSLSGCLFTRTVYVPHGSAVRLREELKSVEVWVLDENGEPVAGKMPLPEGWYCLPDPGEDE
jgi:hypothetical protein